MDLKQLIEVIRDNLDKYVIMNGLFINKLKKMQSVNSMTPEFIKKNALRKLTSINETLTTELNTLEKSCHYFGMDEEGLKRTIQEVMDVFEKFRGSSNKLGGGAAGNPGTTGESSLEITENCGFGTGYGDGDQGVDQSGFGAQPTRAVGKN